MAVAGVDDVGAIVAEVFAHPETYLGRTLTAVGADSNCDAYATTLTRELGVHVNYNHIPADLFKSFGFPGAEELANMFEVQRLFMPDQLVGLIESYALNPDIQSFENWVFTNKAQFPITVEREKQLAFA